MMDRNNRDVADQIQKWLEAAGVQSGLHHRPETEHSPSVTALGDQP